MGLTQEGRGVGFGKRGGGDTPARELIKRLKRTGAENFGKKRGPIVHTQTFVVTCTHCHMTDK